jgi:pimeloyl-ACP methyl ester carboxylesterase
MSYETGFVKAGDFKLHYLKMGRGRKLLVAFHGYGNDASIFLPLERYLGHAYTIYSIDLPYHGKSECEDIRLEKHDLKELVDSLCAEMNVEKASLMGYSLGGRVCITTIEVCPGKIERTVLMSSDGLSFNPLHYFLTNTYMGSRLFKSVLTRPQKYVRFMDWLKERKWLDQQKHSFVSWYLQSEHTRSFLLKVWPCLRKLVPAPRKVRAAIQKHELPVYIFMGMHDKVIPVKLAHSFKRNLKSVHLYVLQKGHRVMDADTLPQITGCLLQ